MCGVVVVTLDTFNRGALGASIFVLVAFSGGESQSRVAAAAPIRSSTGGWGRVWPGETPMHRHARLENGARRAFHNQNRTPPTAKRRSRTGDCQGLHHTRAPLGWTVGGQPLGEYIRVVHSVQPGMAPGCSPKVDPPPKFKPPGVATPENHHHPIR